jgi:hypothetical protein
MVSGSPGNRPYPRLLIELSHLFHSCCLPPCWKVNLFLFSTSAFIIEKWPVVENIDQRPAGSSAGLKLSVVVNQWLGIWWYGEKAVASACGQDDGWKESASSSCLS